VAFVYQSIEWTWVPTGLSTSDSLLFRRAAKARGGAGKSAVTKT
jgi:hypothetical protein